MAERTILTAGLFANVAFHLCGTGGAGSPYTHIGCDTASMAGLGTASTSLATEGTANGFARAAGTATTTATTHANDTFQLTNQFTCATAPQVIYGAGAFLAAAGSTLGVFHEWAASVAFEIGDKVTETIQIQAKAD